LVVSGFVLGHFHTRWELNDAFVEVAALLTPGGLTVHLLPPIDEPATCNTNGAGTPSRNTSTRSGDDGGDYAATMHRAELPVPGDTAPVVLYDADWSGGEYLAAAAAAGLVDASLRACDVSPEGLRELGEAYWESKLEALGKYMVLVARKPL
jgi:hypothetical protein